MTKDKEIFYYDASREKRCLLYISTAKTGSVRVSPGPDSEDLPFGWKDLVQDAFARYGCTGSSDSLDDDIVCHRTNPMPNQLLSLIYREVAKVILNILDSSSIVTRNFSHDPDVAEIQFKCNEIQAVFICVDLRDSDIIGVDLSQCENDMLITIKRYNPLAESVSFDVIIEKVCDTVSEYAQSNL